MKAEAVNHSPLTILHVCEHFGGQKASLHGVARAFQWWLPTFSAQEFRVLLCSRKGPDRASEQMQERGIEPYFLGYHKLDPRNLFKLIKLVRREHVDILHAHGYGACLWARLTGLLLRKPVIVHERCNYRSVPLAQRPVEWLLGPLTRYAFAVSESTRQFCIHHRHIKAAVIEVLYNGVPDDEFTEHDQSWIQATRQAAGFTDKDIVIGIVSRLEAHKGHRDALSALSDLLPEYPNLRLWILGDGVYEPELKKTVADLQLEKAVVFGGFRPDVRDIMQCFDIMLFPSHQEGTPNTLFEAFHTRQCIAASTADGQGEILTDRKQALLFEPGDITGMCSAIAELASSPELREQLSRAAGAASAKFNGDACIEGMEARYRDIAREWNLR